MAGAGVFFTDGEKVLLLKRGDGDHKGKWGLPGGKIEEGESPMDAASRESKEECGAPARGTKFGRLEEKDGTHSWTTFFFRVKTMFKCKLSKEHTDYKWVDIGEIDKMDLHPSLRNNLSRHISLVVNKRGFKEWLNVNLL